LNRQRIDKWLWHARVVRTRSDAATLATSGHVRINGQRVDAPSRAVRVGDVVTVALDRAVQVLRVLSFSERRGSPEESRKLCEPIERLARYPEGERHAGGPRPTKRERRALTRLTGTDED
jgi:ribosome-associated heat shock protein Hsp15